MKRINEYLFLLGKQQRKTLFGVLVFLFSFTILQAQNVADYRLDKLGPNLFQVSILPYQNYAAPLDNLVSNMQVVVKVRTGGFVVTNLTNLINNGAPNEVVFTNGSRNDTPMESPLHDYLSFSLLSLSGTTDIPFVNGVAVPLFTFQNGGACTEDSLSLILPTDPFYPTNMIGANAQQQLTVLGYGQPDAPVGVTGIPKVADCTKECFMGCNDNVQVSLGQNCTAEVFPEMVATALNLTCPNGRKGIEILDNGQVIPSSPFLNESHIGKTFQVRVIDSITTNSCWGSIIVKDKTPPVIACQDDTLSCGIQDISPDNPLFGYPTVTDNCSATVLDLTYTDNIIRNTCATGFSGQLERTWRAVDAEGRVGTCQQNIYFEKQSLDAVVFPPNRNGMDAPLISCSDGATNPSNAGVPTLNGDALYPNFVGFCEINAGYRDDSVSFCIGNRRVVRTWTVVDACTGVFRTDVQIINVRDTTPPVMTCLDTIRGTVDAGLCSGTVNFPAIIATDACSGAKITIETPFGTINSNGGVLSSIPVGFHPIIYIATDSCNNMARCTTILEVADRTAPIAICDFVNDVSLRANGQVTVFASVFDDGSRDGCSGNQLTFKAQIVGDTLDFADFVTFYCNDAGDTVRVNLSVTDLSGNTDYCVAAIVITNDTPPQISCPADRTIQCTDDFSDLTAFGVPTIQDDCGGMTNYTERDSFELNSCGVGNIYRIFSINSGASVIRCQQVIRIENTSTFDGNTIIWPANYAVFACNNVPLHPDSLPFGFNIPRYDDTGSFCNRVLQNYTDAVFDDVVDPVGCYTILRTWNVIDQCIFNPNDTLAGGYWSHVQQISLVNSEPPVFNNCPTGDYEVDIMDNTCRANVPLLMTATDACTPDKDLTYTYEIDIDSDGTTDFNGTTNDATGFYPIGNHRVSFTVQDDCGNVTSCNFRLIIRDNTQPSAICTSETVPINIIDNGGNPMAVVPALALNSTDNCTAFSDLTITNSPSSFTCTQLGLNQVNVTVTDQSGNSNTCTATVDVQDTNNHCPMNRTAVNISGVIVNEMGVLVEQVEVSINHPEVVSSMTGQNGAFKLVDVPVGKDYTILPKRNFDLLNGVSTFDLVLINRHILNIQPITSPYRLIAGDVNRSNAITTYDMVLLRKLILRLSTELPNNTSWRFIKGGFQFKNQEEPLKDYFPEVYNINNLPNVDMQTEGFVAIKVGDVNGSASPIAAFVEGESRSATNQLLLQTAEQTLVAGTTVSVPISANNFNQVLGFQFALNFNPNALELAAILPNKALTTLNENNFGLDFIKRGLITTSWEQSLVKEGQAAKQVLFTLQFKVKESILLSEALSIQQQFMKAEAYAEIGEEQQPELLSVDLLIEKSKKIASDFKLYQNKPNPFQENTRIGFELSHTEVIDFTLLDITGRIVKKSQHKGLKGYNELLINSSVLGGKGVYYYQLSTTAGMKTRKMLVVE